MTAGQEVPAEVPTPAPVLTGREMQVLIRVAHGKTNGDIGRELFLSEDTIKTHVRRIFRKLGARDRAQMIHLAHETGVLGGKTARVPGELERPAAPVIQLDPRPTPEALGRSYGDHHVADCDLFRARACDCRDRRAATDTTVQEGRT